jgi:hypothetical protein
MPAFQRFLPAAQARSQLVRLCGKLFSGGYASFGGSLQSFDDSRRSFDSSSWSFKVASTFGAVS